jgi:hypothetical protein
MKTNILVIDDHCAAFMDTSKSADGIPVYEEQLDG